MLGITELDAAIAAVCVFQGATGLRLRSNPRAVRIVAGGRTVAAVPCTRHTLDDVEAVIAQWHALARRVSPREAA